MTDLFEIILMALACPLYLPLIKEMQEESEDKGAKK